LTYTTQVQETTAVKTKHYPVLDALRGVAILDVMLFHFGGGYKGSNPSLRIWSAVVDSGWMGVDLFFVLSGFLITGILFDTACTENRARNFYTRRALRIFPVFYGVLLGLLLLTPVLHLHWKTGHLLLFFFLSNMTGIFAPNLGGVHNWINLSHLWSLAVEEQFYLMWPFVVWRVRNRRKLLWIILGVLIAGPILRGLFLWGGVDPETISRLLITRADSLLFGGAVALMVRGPEADRVPAMQIFFLSAAALMRPLPGSPLSATRSLRHSPPVWSFSRNGGRGASLYSSTIASFAFSDATAMVCISIMESILYICVT
jgi:peptidoglycan/LPS O-acetylase OafA/YrhL